MAAPTLNYVCTPTYGGQLFISPYIWYGEILAHLEKGCKYVRKILTLIIWGEGGFVKDSNVGRDRDRRTENRELSIG